MTTKILSLQYYKNQRIIKLTHWKLEIPKEGNIQLQQIIFTVVKYRVV